jgi:predicted SAM-dependent methyltransferase
VGVCAGSDLVRLNLGAGKTKLDGYLTVDLCEGVDIQSDVRTLALPDAYADEIMAIHLFEHLFRWDAEPTLREWFRVLKPGGKLVLELPDLMLCCQNILNGAEDRYGLFGLFGGPAGENPLMVHKWAYSFVELKSLVRGVGFDSVKRRPVQFHKKQRDMRLEAYKPMDEAAS